MKSYQNTDDEKIKKIVDNIILEIKKEINDEKLNFSEEIESVLNSNLNNNIVQNTNQHENNVAIAPYSSNQFSTFLDSLNLFQDLYNVYDNSRLENSKKILKTIRRLLHCEINDWLLFPLIQKQTSFNVETIKVLEFLFRKISQLDSQIIDIKSSLEELHSEASAAKLDLEKMQVTNKDIQSHLLSLDKKIDEKFDYLQRKVFDPYIKGKNFIYSTKKLKDKLDYQMSLSKLSSDNILHLIDVPKMAYSHSDPITERFTEYMWILKNLKTKGCLLDVGCSESIFAEELSAKTKLEVYGIDIREYENPNFNFYKESALKMHFKNDFFDQVTAISSVEHFGLPWYSNTDLDSDADQKTMKEIKRVLKPSGTLLITVPFGKGEGYKWCRKYNKKTLENLLKDFKIEEMSFFTQTELGWYETDYKTAEECEDSVYFDELPSAIAVCKATK